MRALVTGAAGFIGSHLSETLVSDGVAVRGVDRLSSYYDPARKRANISTLLEDDGFEFIEANLNELGPEGLLEDVDTVFHLAGQPGVRVSWGREFEVYVEDNVLSTQRLLEAAREQSLDRFVLASSSSIYGDAERFPTSESETPAPVSPYGVTKLAAEHLCQLYFKGFGVPIVRLRYFTIFGPRQRPDMAFTRFIRAALEGRPIEVFGDGLQERDFTYVGDAVAATVAAASSGRLGSVYNVSGGNRATVLEVIEALEKLTGKKLSVEHLPGVVGDARRTGADTARARTELGYSPGTTLEEGLSRQLEAERGRLDPETVG
jgi:nucleoside-diphosphate-sugar epimerase